MTNDMRVMVECSALSVMSACSVSESYFKTKGSDGIQIERRVFSFFWGGALWDGGWWSGFNCVLSHCSSLTNIWKVPLGKYSGLPWLITVSWLEMPADCSIKELHERRPQLSLHHSSHGGECMSTYSCMGHAWGMWTIDMAPRQGSNQRSSARSTSVQVMSKEKGAGSFFFFFKSWRLF